MKASRGSPDSVIDLWAASAAKKLLLVSLYFFRTESKSVALVDQTLLSYL